MFPYMRVYTYRELGKTTWMLEFRMADTSKELDALVIFLSGHTWPYHVTTRLSYSDARSLIVSDSSKQLLYWIIDNSNTVGLLRVLDIEDVFDGAPMLDVRIAEKHRGEGIGTEAVRWIVRTMFHEFEALHRIEASTREDNISMQRILAKAGFLLEGRLRRSWKLSDGGWADTLVYGILRQDIGRKPSMGEDEDANQTDAQLMVRHNRRLASADEDDGDLDIELTVRHNRPAPAGDIELMVRHNRRMPAAAEDASDTEESDSDVFLTVRHTRPMTDLDIELTVRHARPMVSDDMEDAQTLDVRHNRPFIDVDDDAQVELTVRHNRPMS
jgi:RimJ/RimL family protein N-acetyltransferase